MSDNKKRLPLVKMSINPDSGSLVSAISMVNRPAIGSNFIAFSNDEKSVQVLFSTDEKQELFGAAMIPDLPMYRNTKGVGEYVSIFSAATIREIAQEFAKNGFFNNMNIDHSDRPAGSYVFQSYIVDTDKGVNAPMGLDVPNGTWIVGVKVDDAKVWQEVKDGKVQGFSVEGIFELIDLKVDISVEQFQTLLEFEQAIDDMPKGCLMFMPDVDPTTWEIRAKQLLPNATEIETQPHVTIVYGLPDFPEMPITLKSFLSTAINGTPIDISLGNLAKFIQDGQDVVFVNIIDNNGVITELNAFLSTAFSIMSDYDEYKPHMTVGYQPNDPANTFSSDQVQVWDFGINNVNKGKIVYSDADMNITELITVS